jgi:uncharacterized membrane protein YccC
MFPKEMEFWRFLQDELSPFPGRSLAAVRIVIAVVATVILNETLRVPYISYSAYAVFFIANDDGYLSFKLGLMAMMGATVALAISSGVSICFMDAPWFRLPVMFILMAAALWLSRAAAQPVMVLVGRFMAIIFALYLSLADIIFDAEDLTESTLWLWSVVGVPVGLTVLVNLIFTKPPSASVPVKKGEQKQGFLLEDAFTNPEYLRFAGRTILALTICEVFMNAVTWPGIRTCMITCAATALSAMAAQRQKQALRVAGVCVGGLIGVGAIVSLVPHMDTIVSLVLLIAPCTFVFAWIARSSPRLSYAGFQMALAFYYVLLPGFETSIDLTTIRDRFIGILVGTIAMWLSFDHLWPSNEPQTGTG